MGAALLWDIPLRPQAIKNLNPQLMQPKRQKLNCTEHGRFRAHQEQWGSGPAHPAQAHQLTHSWQPQPEPTKGGLSCFTAEENVLARFRLPSDSTDSFCSLCFVFNDFRNLHMLRKDFA